jgi:hypothetical protein
MKKIIITISSTAILLMCTAQLLAQTYTADYVKDNNGYLAAAQTAHASNIFNPTVTVDNLANYSFAGAVTWSSGNGIVLQENGFQSQAAGTAFYINFSFLPGYKYNISIVATSNYLPTYKNTLTSLNTSIVPSASGSYYTPSTTATAPEPDVITYNLLGIGQSTFYPQSNSSN